MRGLIQFSTSMHPYDASLEIAKVLADEVFNKGKPNMNTWIEEFNNNRLNTQVLKFGEYCIIQLPVNCKDSTMQRLRQLKNIHISKIIYN